MSGPGLWPIWIGAVITAVAVVIALRGLARERAAQASAQHASTLKNEFVAMVSHELRTPLTLIAGFGATLLESWRELPPAEVDEFLGIITRQSSALGDLVEDVLVIPRLEAGRLPLQLDSFDLAELVHQVNTLLSSPDSPAVVVAIPSGTYAYADPRRSQQVVRNLLENALKYGGDQILVEGALVGDRFLITVSDNGPGIAAEDIERVFDHFEQLSTGDARAGQGIGLGLPIARKLARAMGGDVWYEHRFPIGARFCFTVLSRAPVAGVGGGSRRGAPPPRIHDPSGRGRGIARV